MGKNKMIAKSCPKCELQVAVASKSCKCGHMFFISRRAADHLRGPAPGGGGGGGGGLELRRRTARVTRAQPQFYDSQHYQKQKRRSPKKRTLSGSADDYKGKEKESATARARRRRALRRAAREAAGGAGRGSLTPPRALSLRPPQLARCALILKEINRKMAAVTWQPPC